MALANVSPKLRPLMKEIIQQNKYPGLFSCCYLFIFFLFFLARVFRFSLGITDDQVKRVNFISIVPHMMKRYETLDSAVKAFVFVQEYPFR